MCGLYTNTSAQMYLGHCICIVLNNKFHIHFTNCLWGSQNAYIHVWLSTKQIFTDQIFFPRIVYISIY